MSQQLPAAEAADDPYLWLEGVTDSQALEWVKQRNAESEQAIAAGAEFKALERDLKAILDSDAKIPYVQKMGEHYYNFWKDQKHQRGLWRRTTLAEYRKDSPQWEVLIDLDALNKAEGENWVWHGADCLKPDYTRCLISLSRGGADADVTREFDSGKKEWIKDGFFRPEAKGGLGWIDQDRVYVYTDFGPGSLTSSGYPRQVKEWRRGTPMSEAKLVYEGLESDLYIAAGHDDTPGFERDYVSRALAFYNNELYLRQGEGLVKIEAPNSANKSIHREWLLLELREPWEVGGKQWQPGSLLATKLDSFLAGKRDFDALFEPSETTSLDGFSATRHHLLLNVMDDVKNRLFVLTPGADGWAREPLKGAPSVGRLSATAVDPDHSDAYFLTVSDFITPTRLMLGAVGEAPQQLKALPSFFDATGLQVSQHFATSKDGTRVPYFQVASKDLPLNGRHPTLLYGYGGFEVSLTPSYSASAGRGWLSRGGVYVIANIRGGGEYGPRWHQAALKQNRLRAYEDFAAVAQDLIDRKVTGKAHLGIQGGSNGGLLVGNMVTLYPDLFEAAVCQVPLLDMKRYNKLLAGASWMAEYGDPDKSEEWDFIRHFSPYHNVEPGQDYPAMLFTTSTRDDRVHPGHARKMMARMMEQGHEVLYYENIEGGHGGAADNSQAAHMQALAYAFLWQRLAPKTEETAP
ncbi:prolyl oligopeptidase family serine peptidase [Pseudomarimonas arenosa]|uniref:S9 family peptidase n=1 Tax=Pseudomarimonas arenosa TaxID=2774145 RepID=A0AAW3ZI14_9GAMM|nr:prolyl oligopeptidase family serine peptidase [Pseudomarimonas arenosa]MBD8525169.1 S9 family peptidase [Pseudomarimonas arenosa]